MTSDVDTVVRRWGNSYAVLLPKEVVNKERLKENAPIHLLVFNPLHTLKGEFGLLKGKIKHSEQEVKDWLRRELYDDD